MRWWWRFSESNGRSYNRLASVRSITGMLWRLAPEYGIFYMYYYTDLVFNTDIRTNIHLNTHSHMLPSAQVIAGTGVERAREDDREL